MSASSDFGCMILTMRWDQFDRFCILTLSFGCKHLRVCRLVRKTMISFASASQITRTSHDLLEWPWQQRNFTPSGDNVLCKQSVDMSHMRNFDLQYIIVRLSQKHCRLVRVSLCVCNLAHSKECLSENECLIIAFVAHITSSN